MHTSALTPAAPAYHPSMAYEGQVVEPVSLEHDPRTGQHSLRIVLQPVGSHSRRIIAHVPVEPGETATVAAQAVADRINRAAKQGRDAIEISAAPEKAVLVLRCAAIVSHEEPQPQETKPPKSVRVETISTPVPHAARPALSAPAAPDAQSQESAEADLFAAA
jgi:hypothetical protein